MKTYSTRRVAKAVRAEALLGRRTAGGSLRRARGELHVGLARTTIDDAAGREKLFLAINIVGKVRDHLACRRCQRQAGAGGAEGACAGRRAEEAVRDRVTDVSVDVVHDVFYGDQRKTERHGPRMAAPGALVDREDAEVHDAAERERLVGLARSAHWLFAVLALLVFLTPDVSRGGDEPSDREIYHLAVDYCRAPVPRPMALSSDQRILCFDGWIDDGVDLSSARDLKEFGFFVVRSLGGHDATAVALAHMLRDRHATVVVYDFCISTCANYFLIASDQAYVIGNTLVAWHGLADDGADCTSSQMSSDERPAKIERVPCPGAPYNYVEKYREAKSTLNSLLFGANGRSDVQCPAAERLRQQNSQKSV